MKLASWLRMPTSKSLPVAPGVVLHLSGPALDQAYFTLQKESVKYGGMERILDAMAAKAEFFRSQLADGAVSHLNEAALYQLVAFMPSVRRRIAPSLKQHGIAHFRDAFCALFEDGDDPLRINERMETFAQAFPTDKKHRWIRDLAAEALHYCSPGIYPLMTRWIWDAKANSGVLREIWHSDEPMSGRLDVPDDFRMHVNLRDELIGYTINRGIVTDPELFVDLICAQVYGEYVSNQGASYLNADFSNPDDDLQYTLRMLGLDVADAGNRQTKVKLIDGARHHFSANVNLTAESAA